MALKLSLSTLLLTLLVVGFTQTEGLRAWLVDRLWPELDEPVPTLVLRARPYRVQVAAEGRLTGRVTTRVYTPKGRTSLKIAWLVEEGKVVAQGDLLVRFDNTDAQLALEMNEVEVSSLDFQLEKTDAERRGTLTGLEKDRASAVLEYDYARNQIRKDGEIFSRWEIEESASSAELARSRMDHVGEQVQLQETLSEAQKEILAIERGTKQEQVNLARSTLSSLEVLAPVDGVVLYKRVWRKLEVGAEVWPEQPLMEIATQNRLQGELHVVETAVAGVAAGKPVRVRLPAIPGRVFEGEVTSVAQVADQIAKEDPRRYFLCQVSIEIPEKVMPLLKPGMRMEGEIVAHEFESAVVVPRSAVFKEEGGFRVFVAAGQQYQPRGVEILAADHGFYVISGAREGEEICARHPFEKEMLHLPDFSAPAGPAGTRSRIVVF